MDAPTESPLLPLPTAGTTSRKFLNLTGKFINLPFETLAPSGDAHTFRPYKAGEKLINGVEFTVFSFLLSPLPEPTPNVIIIVSEEMAKHYSTRSDVFYPLPDESETYLSGAPHRYRGLARYLPSNTFGERSHPDGF